MTGKEEHWKKKYLKEAEALERAHRDWQGERLLLHRLLARTSVAASGQTQSLDKMLDELRDNLRNGESDLEILQDIRKRLDRELVDMVTPHVDDGVQRARIIDTVLHLMDRLLDSVELGEESRVRLMALRDKLAQHYDWEALHRTIDEINKLIGITIKHMQDEFAGFLRLLDYRLLEVQESLESHLRGVRDRKLATTALEVTTQENLQVLGESVRSSTSIEDLKNSVVAHVDLISGSVVEFHTSELISAAAIEEELAGVKDKLRAVESESNNIQQLLDEERVRATTDSLTRLPNRIVWEERLAFEEARWQRYQHPAVIGVIDIDDFKHINDTHGHKIGDRVLRLVAQTMRANLRRTDFIARYGGEEFVMLLTDTRLEAAKIVADGLRKQVEAMPLQFQGAPVRVTISLGLAAMGTSPTAAEVFDLADRALYQAKSSGRNMVCIADVD